MTQDEIQKEWDSFIEYPEGSGKLYVTTTSALLFARCIADMAADKEREACAELLELLQELCECPQWVDEATIPKAGIDAAPQQVVINMSVGLVRLRNARAAIAKATGETT